VSELTKVEHTCKSCGYLFAGIYCPMCGEKVLNVKDRKFKSFLGNVLIAITFADNKFVKTLWLVIRKPGFLSKEYVEGVRVKYLRPLQLFFILNLVYFLFPVFQLFNSSLYTQMYLLPHSSIVSKLVSQKMHDTGMSRQAFSLVYDAKSQSLAKLLIVVFIIIASIPMSVIYRRKNLYFTDHTALAVELACFNLAINALFLSVMFWVLNTLFNWGEFTWGSYLNDFSISIFFIATNLYFLWVASRTFYQQKGKRMIVKAFLALIGLYLSLEVYRLMLFFITYWSL
jgi:Protein of unknown function (DUF3667)